MRDLKLFIWEGNGISEAYHDDGTLVVLAESPEQARSIALASARAAVGRIVNDPAVWSDGLGWSRDYAKKDVPNDAIHREPDRIVELDQPQVVAFNGGGYD